MSGCGGGRRETGGAVTDESRRPPSDPGINVVFGKRGSTPPPHVPVIVYGVRTWAGGRFESAASTRGVMVPNSSTERRAVQAHWVNNSATFGEACTKGATDPRTISVAGSIPVLSTRREQVDIRFDSGDSWCRLFLL